MAKNPETGVEYRDDIPGFNVRWNSKGYCIVTVDYWADPNKRDPKWAEKEKRKYPDIRSWRREMERDWTMASGESFYPEFQFRQESFVRAVPYILPDKPVIRGWDFGYKFPACVWMQQADSGRVAFLRELMPMHISIHDFRDLVRYLSGEVPLELLKAHNRERALREVRRIEAANERPYNKYPKPPWFERDTKFIDFSGPEALMVRSIEGEKSERNDYEVLAAGGIQLSAIATRVSAREHAFRFIMGQWDDGEPGLFVDPSCQYLIEGLGGGIAYKKPTPINPEPQDPAKDGFYEHLHDAAGYALAQIVKLMDEQKQPKNRRWEGRRLVAVEDESSLGWSVDPNRYGRLV